MAFAAGGKLAAAVTAAGGLGLIGGGYGDAEWLEREFGEGRKVRDGCGFFPWSVPKRPTLLDLALAHSPAAVIFSFGSPIPFARRIKAVGVKLICQVQNMEHARAAVDVGAQIIVAQGAEAGGHGLVRATFTLVPEIAEVGIPFTHVGTPDSVEGWKARQGIPSLGLIILGRFRSSTRGLAARRRAGNISGGFAGRMALSAPTARQWASRGKCREACCAVEPAIGRYR